jgi:WD40 repeat protein
MFMALFGMIVWAQESNERLHHIEYIDSDLVAVVKNDGSSLEIIDSRTGKTVITLPFSRTGRINALLVTDEDLFVGKTDGYIDRFRLADRTNTRWERKSQYKVSDAPVTSLAHDRGRLVAGDRRGKMTELNPGSTRDNVKVLGGHADAAIIYLGIAQSGTLISLADDGIRPRVWSTSGRITGYLDTGGDAALVFVMSKDRKKTAVYSSKEVRIFKGTELEKTIPLLQENPIPPVIGGDFSHDVDAKYLMLATMDGAVVLNTKTGEVVTRHQGLGPSAVAWRSDNRQYALYNNDWVRFFNAPERPMGILKITSDADVIILINGKEPDDGGSISSGVERAIAVDIGKINISLQNDPRSKILLNGREIRSLELNEGATTVLFIKPPEITAQPTQGTAPALKSGLIVPVADGTVAPRIIRSARDGSLILADYGKQTAVIEKGKDLTIQIISNPSGSTLTAFDVAPDKSTFYLGDDHGLLRIIETATGKERQLKFEGAISTVEADTVITITVGTKIYLTNPGTAQALHDPIDFGANISAAALYGERLVVGGINGDAAIINSNTGQYEPRIFGLRNQPVTALCWIDKGKYIAISYQDGLTLIYNSISGIRSLDPIRGSGPVRALSVSENSKRLGIVYGTSIAQVDLNTGKTVETISLREGSKGTATYWLAENKLAVGGSKGIEFYTGSAKKAEFLLYPGKGPDGVWVFITTPLYSYSASYYAVSAVSNEDIECEILTVKLHGGNETRPLAAEDRIYRNINKAKGEL